MKPAYVQAFFALLLILAYAEDRWIPREATIAIAFTAWLALWLAARRDDARADRQGQNAP